MRIGLGYPDRSAERGLLAGADPRSLLASLPAQLSPEKLSALQEQVQAVHVADALLDYLQDLIEATRNGQWFVQGLSPRAGMAVLRAAKARALLRARDYVVPDDMRSVLVPTIAHRLTPVANSGLGAAEQVLVMLDTVALS